MSYFIRTLTPFVAVAIAAFCYISMSSLGAENSFLLSDAQEVRVREGLSNVLAKLQAGEEVRIAYLGGSITAQPGWRVKTTAWIQSQFPQAKVVEVYAALGGTGSELGVFRIDREVIPKAPDLLFVEFAVNDSRIAPEQIQKTMEGIVRKIWRANPRTDICFVYTLKQDMLEDLQAGKFPTSASAMERVADHYGIPSIHMGVRTANLERQGKLLFQGPKPVFPLEGASATKQIVFSPDGVHPYPSSGHVLYFEAIERSMKAIAKVSDNPGDHALGDPLWKDNWEDATMVSLDRSELSSGWKRLDPSKDDLAKRLQATLPALYRADQPGESITFQFKGTDARILDLMGPDCGGVLVQVDDQLPKRQLRFDAYCVSYRIGALPVATGLPDEVHQITLTIDAESPDKGAILSKRGNTIDDPQRFEGVAWYPSAILLRGTIVEPASNRQATDVFVPHPVVLKKRDVTTLKIGAKAPDFRLRGVDGRWHSLADFDDAKVLALVFTCNHCPAAQKFEDDFNQIVKDYADKGVALVAISSSSPLGVEDWELGFSDLGDDFDSMKIRAKDHDFLFPYLYDGDKQEASLAYGAMATPHVFVFDADRALQYVGRPGLHPTKANKLTGRATELRAALDAILAGRKVSPNRTPLVGCSTKWSWKNGHLSAPWNDWRQSNVTLTDIDLEGVQALLANDSRGLRLVNVWATWCTACIGEYSEFVKLHGIYHPRQIHNAKSSFEFVSLCLDDPESKDVAKRLLDRFESRLSNHFFDMDHLDELVATVDPEWNGALPYTLLIEAGGRVLYRHQGAVDFEKLRKIIIEHPTMGRLQ